MSLPTFLLIGAMKAGTTTLWSRLREQPGVHMSEEKELDFFVAEKQWRRGVSWYEAQFGDVPAGTHAIGEASTNYSKFPLFGGVPGRVHGVLPDIRLVYLLRHPVERMRSHWLHARSIGWERRPFGRAISRDPQYVDISRYAFQLEQWLPYVPREHILVETTEHLHADADAVLARVLSFVGVDAPVVTGTDVRAHTAEERSMPRRAVARALRSIPGAGRVAQLAPEPLRRRYGEATTLQLDRAATALSPEHEAELVDRLRPDLVRLRDIVGGDFDAWGLV